MGCGAARPAKREERGGGLTRDVVPIRPPRAPPQGILAGFCQLEDGCVACFFALEHPTHSFATISGNSVLALKGHLNHRFSRETLRRSRLNSDGEGGTDSFSF